jgi:hypothetical protein
VAVELALGNSGHLGRAGAWRNIDTPDEGAWWIVNLSRPEVSYVTGAVLPR